MTSKRKEKKKNMADMSCLAEGLVVEADFQKTGLNLNEMIVGPTGSGKSFSNAYSRLAHTTESSVVLPIAKKAIKEKFAVSFVKKGYKVVDLDFAHPENCNVGYDPLNYVHSDEDVIHLARRLVDPGEVKIQKTNVDPYWTDCATSILAAEIALIRLNAKESGEKPSFGDVLTFHRSIKTFSKNDRCFTNMDELFEELAIRYPDNQASEMWKTVQGLASRTASIIWGTVNTAVDKLFTENIFALTKKEEKVSFKELGEKKVALFITTSPMNKALQNLLNIMYEDLFRELFEAAESMEDSRLEIPVHIICDDFACGSRIMNFEEYISIFRAAGISVTLLLQSESQLTSMYGEQEATTIINNCDTYVYLGGTDDKTCQSISLRMNKPFEYVRSLPLEQVVVFRRGSKPYVGRRYQTLQDPLYQEIMQDSEK